jgi:hypothetical protein
VTYRNETERTRLAVEALDAIDAGDPEAAHSEADAILLAYVPDDIRDAYDRLVARAHFWATA